MKKTLYFGFIAAILFFGWFNTSHAIVLFSQVDNSTLSEHWNANSFTHTAIKQDTENFLPKLQKNKPFTIKIYNIFPFTNNTIALFCNSVNGFVPPDSNTYNPATGLLTATFDTQFWVNLGNCQNSTFVGNILIFADPNLQTRGSALDLYPFGDAVWLDNFLSNPKPDSHIKDIYFVVEQGGNVIDFSFPKNGDILPFDFNFWGVDYGSELENSDILITYTNGTQAYDDAAFGVATGSFSNFKIKKNNSLSIGTWAAQAFLLSSSSQVLAQSNIITFEIKSTSTPISTETASTTCAGYGFIGEPLCKLAFVLFVPSQDTLNKFTTSTDGSDLVSLAGQKIPFSWFNGVKNSLNNLGATTSTFSLQLGQLSSFFDSVKTLIGVILWVLFLIFLLYRLSRLEL